MTDAERPPSSPDGEKPWLVPCLLISKGRIMLPAEGGPVVAHAKDGSLFDLFEVTDRLMAEHGRVYVVDLDGVDQDQPQLDYLQEIARGGDIWVDAGVRTADQAIDVLVAGAQRAVLSTSFLRSERELLRAWRLSSDLVFEIEVRDGAVAAHASEWSSKTPGEIASQARGNGPNDIVLSYRESPIDWNIARSLARDGPLWIGSSFDVTDADRLTEAGCRGALFHLNDFLSRYEPAPAKE